MDKDKVARLDAGHQAPRRNQGSSVEARRNKLRLTRRVVHLGLLLREVMEFISIGWGTNYRRCPDSGTKLNVHNGAGNNGRGYLACQDMGTGTKPSKVPVITVALQPCTAFVPPAASCQITLYLVLFALSVHLLSPSSSSSVSSPSPSPSPSPSSSHQQRRHPNTNVNNIPVDPPFPRRPHASAAMRLCPVSRATTQCLAI